MPSPLKSPTDRIVLIVEDEDLIRILAIEALEEAGFTVIEAGHAEQALEALGHRADKVRVLFTDVHMPGPLNGVQLAHQTRRNWPWIYVIVSSGHLMPSSNELPEGSWFIPKPYEMQRVVDHIREAIAS